MRDRVPSTLVSYAKRFVHHMRRGARLMEHALVFAPLNVAAALGNSSAVSRAQEIVAKIEDDMVLLANRLPVEPTGQIPRILHFVYGFKKPEKLPYYAYMAIRSALHYNPGWRAILHYYHEPYGLLWEKLKPLLSLNPIEDFEYYRMARFRHYAHKADIVRLLALKNIGGAYLDIDTLTARSFDPLLKQSFVIGVQDEQWGLCNAVMLSQPRARFVTRWLANYASFHSKGRDPLWDFHSVRLPLLMSYTMPSDITVLGRDAFCYPLWMDLVRLLLSDGSARWCDQFASSYVFHLWNNYNEESLDAIDEQFVRSSTSFYAEIARPCLEAQCLEG